MDTVVIEIRADYKDNTRGMSKSIDGMDKFSRSIDKTKQQMEKASKTTDNWYQKIKNIAGKVISIPVKIIDKATSPLRKLYNFATSLKGVLTGLFVGQIGSTLVKTPVSLADQLESASMFFERKLGSVKEAQKFLQEIYKFDEKSPFDTMQIIDITKSMMGVGWTRKDVLKDIGIIGDFSASMGLGTEGVQRISRQLGQMRMKSKLSQEEINVLNETGLNAWQYIADAMGVDVKTARALNEKKGSAINGEDAVKWILQGIEKEYGGAANSASDRTLSGIMDQMKSFLQTKVALKWGQGLAEGARTGFGTLKEMLDENEETISKFGDTLQDIGKNISTWLFDRANNALTRLKETIDSPEFKNADLGGKLKLVWNDVIAEPFMTWWNGEGGTKVKKKAEQIGTSVGEWIGKGLGKAFGEIIPNLFSNAGKLIPGGEKADGGSLLSAAVLAYGANGLGLGKLAGWGLGKIGTAAATGTAGAAGATGAAASAGVGLTSISGWLLGGLGLVSAINDFNSGAKAYTERKKQEYDTKGLTKMGLTALGTAIGTIIAPGIGTAIGAAIGGGAALLGGDSLGTWIAGERSGLNKHKRAAKNIKDAAESYEVATAEAESFNDELERLKDVKSVVDIAKAPDAAKLKTLESLKATLKELDGESTASIIVNALINGEDLNEDNIAAIESRLSDLDGKEIEIYTKLANGEGDPSSLQSELDAIEEEGLTLKAILEPNVDNVTTALAAVEERGIELRAKLGTAKTKTEIEALQKEIKQNKQYKLMLEATVQGFDPNELAEFESQIESLKSSLVEASDGLLTAYEAEHGALDTTIEKLEKINELKEKEAELAMAEVAIAVAEGRNNKQEQEKQMAELKTQMEGNEGDVLRYADMQLEASQLVTNHRIGSKDGLSEGEYKGYVKEWKAFADKYADTGWLNGLIDFDENDDLMPHSKAKIMTPSQEGFMGSHLGEHVDLIDALDRNAEEFIGNAKELNGEYANLYDLYKQTAKGERDLIQQDYEGKYGGSMDELTQGAASGNVEAMTNLLQMIDDIAAKEAEYSYLEDADKFNPSVIMEDFAKNVPNWFAAQFAGQEKVAGDSIEGMIFNELVDIGNSLVTPEDLSVYKDALFKKNEEGKYTGETLSSDEISKMDAESIKGIQEGLINLGYALEKFGPDGMWGPESKAAYEKFQQDYEKSGKTPEQFGVSDKTESEAVTLFKSLLGLANQGGKDTGNSVSSSSGMYDTGRTGTLAEEGVQNFIDNGLQTDAVAGATTSMADSINTASASNGVLADGMNAVGTNAGTAAGNVNGLADASGISKDNINLMGSQSLFTASDVGILGSESGIAAGGVANFGTGASTAAGQIYGAGEDSSLAGIQFLRAAASVKMFADAAIINAVRLSSYNPSAPKMAEGGVLTGPQFVLAGEDGDEAIIPLSRKHRRRGLALFKEAAKRMGIPMMAKGGVVGDDGSEGVTIASVSAPSGGISVSLGGVHFTIQAGSGDAESILAAIKANMPTVANEVANTIAAALEQTYSNMATTGV